MNIEFKSINDFAIVISGYAFKSEWFGTGSDKVIRIGDLQDNLIDIDSALTVDAKSHKVSDNFKIYNNDILIALSGATVGKISVASTKDIGAYINQRVAIIRANNPITANYLKFFFSGKYLDELLKNAGGAAQPNLSPKQLSLMKIPLPPLEEQRRIAEILDKADALIQNRKKAIEKLDELLQATFIDMFGDPVTNPKGWEKSKLSKVLIKITDGTHHSPKNVETGIPYITAKHIKEGYIDFYSQPTFISEADHKNIYSRCDPVSGDVLYIKDGATTGVASINHYEFEFSLLSSVALLRPNKDLITNSFLEAWLNHPIIKKQILLNMGGAAIKRLTLTKIKELPILLPPIALQQNFCLQKNILTQQKQKMQEQLEVQETLFKSLQQQAFSGQL